MQIRIPKVPQVPIICATKKSNLDFYRFLDVLYPYDF